MGRDDDEWRPDGEGSPVGRDPFSLAGLVVPDDARELDADVRALRREQRVQERRARLARLFLTRRWRQYGISGPIVVAVLVLVAGFASLMLLFQPRRPATRPEPLASSGTKPVGEAGGLVPDLSLTRSDGSVVPLRGYRPALVAVLPASCRCAVPLRTYGLAAVRHNIDYVLVGEQLPAPPPNLAGGGVVRASDPAGLLVRRYHPSSQPVLLLVGSDGVLARIVTEEPSASSLDEELAVLAASGSNQDIGR